MGIDVRMSGHLDRSQIEALLTPTSPPSARAAAVRHLLTDCRLCAALARQVLAANGYRLAAGRIEAEPVAGVSYDGVFERLTQRLPELVARAMSEEKGSGSQAARPHRLP